MMKPGVPSWHLFRWPILRPSRSATIYYCESDAKNYLTSLHGFKWWQLMSLWEASSILPPLFAAKWLKSAVITALYTYAHTVLHLAYFQQYMEYVDAVP
jgi:hypothetical protein